MIISLIAAVDEGYSIGSNNQMLWHLPADFAWFRQKTLGKPVIMGRKTYESIGRALPGRKNIVFSAQKNVLTDATVVSTLEQALSVAKETESDEIMIIGGGQIYELFLPYANKIYLTHVAHTFDADAYFPKFEISTVDGLSTYLDETVQKRNVNLWNKVYEEFYPVDEKNCYPMTFAIYEKNEQRHLNGSSEHA